MSSFGLSGKSADVERKLEFTAAASQGFLFGSVERCWTMATKKYWNIVTHQKNWKVS